MTRWWQYGCLAAVGVSMLQAQQGRLAGPVVGFVYDGASHALRPIQGVPGASLMGDPVNLGLEAASAWVSPGQDSAFVVGADRSLHLFRLLSGAGTEVGLNGISFVPQRVVYSPSGTAAALVDSGKAQVFTGLPGAPVLAGSIELSLPRTVVTKTTGGTPLARRVTAPAIAISDDGTYVLNVAAGSTWLLSINGENRRLTPLDVDGQAAFAPGTHDAALVDRFGLALIHDAAGAATREVLAPADDSIASPVGLAFSQDGRTIYVASSAARGVASFDLNGGSRATVSCDCTPASLIPMGQMFRLNEPGPAPLWLLDTGLTGPRIVFVPAAAPVE